jgi:hypothetical protein
MKSFIKNLYYKFYITLADKPWLQLILKLLLYYLLLYIIITTGKPPSPSSEDIDVHKELLEQYHGYLETTDIKTIQDFVSSLNFIKGAFEGTDIWSLL